MDGLPVFLSQSGVVGDRLASPSNQVFGQLLRLLPGGDVDEPVPSVPTARSRRASLTWTACADVWTSRRMFGRSKPKTKTAGSRITNCSMISLRTGGAAVAVRASTCGRPRGLDHGVETQVLRAEVMAPTADAVRLVDHE